MSQVTQTSLRRREFLASAIGGSIGAGAALLGITRTGLAAQRPHLQAGEGTADITPPLGIEMGGFHRPPGKERRVCGIRQTSAVRALVLKHGDTQMAIVSADIAGAGQAMAERIQQQVQARCGIPAENIRFCATHTHSMPGFFFMRQWGALPEEFMGTVEKQTIEAVAAAQADLAPAELSIGKGCAKGGNFNRTAKDTKTDADFTADSTHDERWLDTTLHTLQFRRAGGRKDLLWYHFSAHPVCFADEQAGPDWPGMVADLVARDYQLTPSYLQGHIGDVNPGDGSPWRGDADETTAAVYAAFCQAMENLHPVEVPGLSTFTKPFRFPFDLDRFRSWLDAYRTDPAACNRGPWVDAGFAEAWYKDNADRPQTKTHLTRTLSAVRLGRVGLLFHPAELYSYYGLAIRRDSPFEDTLVVAYADGLIGYLPDPKAYADSEYSAIVVPKILDYPPFTTAAAEEMKTAAVAMLRNA